jgi:glucose dehydrogenase
LLLLYVLATDWFGFINRRDAGLTFNAIKRFKVMNKFLLLAAVALGAVLVVSTASASRAVHAKAQSAKISEPAQLYPTPGADWTNSDGTLANDRYSSLSQINTSNVGKLKMAWSESLWNPANTTYATLGAESSPIESGGVLYMPTPEGVDALSATSGAIKWQYHGVPNTGSSAAGLGFSTMPARALSMGGGYLYIGQADGSIVALNPSNGHPVWTAQVASVGTYGTQTFGESNPFTVYANGEVIAGINGGDSPLRGHIDAYNAKTGALIWRFFTLPDTGDFPFITTWANPAEAATGGAAIWSVPSVDTKLDRVYVGTGNAYPYTGRSPGKDLWANSIVSLDLKTGALKWYFQAVHHDEWDMDCPTPPVLFNATINGKTVPGIAASCKTGYVYEMNRINGSPIFPIKETAVPNLDNGAGQALNTTWPTQPEPTGGAAQIVPHCPTAAQASSMLPGYPTAANGTPYVMTCPFAGTDASHYLVWGPSYSGGTDFPPMSFDPTTNDLYVCANVSYIASENISPTSQTQSTIQGNPLTGETGTVSALNLTTNKLMWQKQYMADTDGTCYSGTLATAGGLVFSSSRGNPGASTPVPGTFYAYNAKTGDQLFAYKNTNQIEGAPITYSVNGTQYVAVDMTGAAKTLVFPGFGDFTLATQDKLVVFKLG